jgi:hypothetical protein
MRGALGKIWGKGRKILKLRAKGAGSEKLLDHQTVVG